MKKVVKNVIVAGILRANKKCLFTQEPEMMGQHLFLEGSVCLKITLKLKLMEQLTR